MNNLILFLVSDPVIGKVISTALESKGYFVLNAADIDHAERFMRDFSPDLLMVRPYTENVSGFDAATYLRRIRPGIPVLIVGGILDDPALDDRDAVKRFEIFPKPFQAVELLAKVREMLTDDAARASGL
jgi:DNA-binding response OmpR family regulator